MIEDILFSRQDIEQSEINNFNKSQSSLIASFVFGDINEILDKYKDNLKSAVEILQNFKDISQLEVGNGAIAINNSDYQLYKNNAMNYIERRDSLSTNILNMLNFCRGDLSKLKLSSLDEQNDGSSQAAQTSARQFIGNCLEEKIKDIISSKEYNNQNNDKNLNLAVDSTTSDDDVGRIPSSMSPISPENGQEDLPNNNVKTGCFTAIKKCFGLNR